MPEYEIDIAGGQLVHWLRDELKRPAPRVRFSASRDYRADEDPDLAPEYEAAGLDMDGDTGSLITVGLLELTPVDAAAGWRLALRVDDIVGPHVPEDDSVAGYPEEIDLDDFYSAFIAPDNGTETLSLVAESEAARERFDAIFCDLIRDRHAG